MRRALGVLGAALVAAAVLTGCVREEEAEDVVQGVEQAITPTPEFVPSATASPPGPQPTVEPAVTPIPLTPTVVPPTPFVTPTATPPLTPTPQPGVCPPAYRTTPADFAEPPPVTPPPEPPGRRVRGGAPYSEGYLTVGLPAGREFIILSSWSEDEANLVISVFDVQSGSSLGIRGDGCEGGRFVRDPAADAAFDEMMSGLEIGSSYVCPAPIREVVGQPPSETRGSIVQGGGPAQLGPLTLDLPAGREFTLAQGLADPGGTFFGVYDVQTRSGLWLRPDGCETLRRVSDPAADAVFDKIVATLQASTR